MTQQTDLLAVLLEMRSGKVATSLNEKFNEVLGAVLETGGKGELTVKLFIKPSKMGMGGAVVEVELDHDVKLKKPELEIGRSFFFVSREGVLTREDPEQTALFGGGEVETQREEQTN